MKNFINARVMLLVVLFVSVASCNTESIADEESLFLDDPIEETDIQSVRKDRIHNNDV